MSHENIKDRPARADRFCLKISGEGPVRRRIMDMGITRGTAITVRKVAPLGDPIEVNVRGYELSLRRDDAEMIEVS